MSFIVIIPARFSSSRLQGKPLVDINGKPMVVHVMEKALASGAERVIVATDHHGVIEVIEKTGGEVCLTSVDHQSGTERLEEVINYHGFNDEQIIVNVQGDEPLIPPQIIYKMAENLAITEARMSTLAVPITSIADIFNTNVVKVVTNSCNYALYFSRASIPWKQKEFDLNTTTDTEYIISNMLRHIGIYAYRAGFIRRYVSWPASPLEKIEALEQLRVLWYGEKIYVAIAKREFITGVDTPEDLNKVRLLLKQHHDQYTD